MIHSFRNCKRTRKYCSHKLILYKAVSARKEKLCCTATRRASSNFRPVLQPFLCFKNSSSNEKVFSEDSTEWFFRLQLTIYNSTFDDAFTLSNNIWKMHKKYGSLRLPPLLSESVVATMTVMSKNITALKTKRQVFGRLGKQSHIVSVSTQIFFISFRFCVVNLLPKILLVSHCLMNPSFFPNRWLLCIFGGSFNECDSISSFCLNILALHTLIVSKRAESNCGWVNTTFFVFRFISN